MLKILRPTLAAIVLLTALPLRCAEPEWVNLLNGKNLDGWESVGKGSWTVLDNGILIGQTDPAEAWKLQSWLYTKQEFDEFDLTLDYWLCLGGNSGVSIGDRLRAKNAVDPKTNGWPTPARTAYEINIDNGTPRDYDISGSIYKLVQAEPGHQRNTDWNTLLIEVRRNLIRVTLNGRVVAEHPGLPERPKAGPIGLQLHASSDVVMFRNIRIRRLP